MPEILIHVAGGLCVAHLIWMLLRLGGRRPRAYDVRKGRPLRIRLDRRQRGDGSGRRSGDRRRSAC